MSKSADGRPNLPNAGLYQKFAVERLVGEAKEGAEYFVLDPVHDPFARDALRTYALVAFEAGLKDLERDILEALDRVAVGDTFYPEDVVFNTDWAPG